MRPYILFYGREPEQPDALGRVQVGDDAVHVAGGVRAAVVHRDGAGPEAGQVVLHCARRVHGQGARVVRLDVLPGARYLAGGARGAGRCWPPCWTPRPTSPTGSRPGAGTGSCAGWPAACALRATSASSSSARGDLGALDGDLELLGQAVDQPAPRAVAGLAQPPGLLRVAHLLRGPAVRPSAGKPILDKRADLRRAVLADVDHQVAELVARAGGAPGAHDEEPVGAHVPVEAPDVGVVDPDALGRLRGPVRAAD